MKRHQRFAAAIAATAVLLAAAAAAVAEEPVRPEDRAARSGTLTVFSTVRDLNSFDIYARNGFPFDVRLTVETTNCAYIVPDDCGVVADGAVVPSGMETLIYTVRRSDIYKDSAFQVRHRWQPASATRQLRR